MSDQSLLEQLRQQTERNKSFSKPEAAPAETKTEAEPAAAPEQPGDPLADLAKLQEQHGAGHAVNPPAAEPKSGGGAGLDALNALIDGEAEPKDAKTETEDDGAALAQLQAMKQKAVEAKSEPASAPDSTPDPEPAPAPATEAKTEKPAKTKRTRKTKTTKPKGEAFVLAIDSVAMIKNGALGEVVHLTDLIAPIADAVASSHRCKEHPQGVEHFGLVEFGNGSSELAAATARYLDKTPFKGVLVVDGSSPEGLAVKDVLIRRADAIIRGVR